MIAKEQAELHYITDSGAEPEVQWSSILSSLYKNNLCAESEQHRYLLKFILEILVSVLNTFLTKNNLLKRNKHN